MSTGIEWTDETWNPTTGCDRVSAGCDNCYALTMAKRLKGMGSADYQTDGDPKTSGPGFGLAVHPHRLDQPLRWIKPRRIFVNSMSDLFHQDVPDEFLHRVFGVMEQAPQHTFQILTKRHARMRSFVRGRMDSKREYADKFADCPTEAMRTSPAARWARNAADNPPANIWLGVSVENQQWADIRIPALLMTPAAVRFLSCEPLLGPVDLTAISYTAGGGTHLDVVNGHHGVPGLWRADAKRIDWVIAGGESGRNARPMHPQWARSLANQCDAAGIPFHFKQWGEWASLKQVPYSTNIHQHHAKTVVAGKTVYRVGKKAAGRELDGRTWDQYPAVAS